MSGPSRRLLLALTLAALVPPGTAAASFTQEPGSPFDVGVRPAGIVTADFNADGRPDLLTMDETTVSVLLRRPTGGYDLEVGSPKTVGGGPSGVAVADFNGDSLPDVALSLFADSMRDVVVLLRQPAGGLVEALGSPYNLGIQAGAVATGDFAGDGAPDIAISNWAGGVRILRREGVGFTVDPTVLPTGTNPRSIAAANFDNAGGTDLAITNNGSGSVTVLLRQGASFNAETGSPFTAGDHPQGVIARDFDGDGRSDLAVANSFDDTVSILLRQPGGGFAHSPSSPAVGDGPVGIASGDFDSDGRPDLVTANQFGSTASVLLQTPGGGWAPDPSSPVATDTAATGVAVADVDADTRPDLAVANRTDNSVSILLNTTPFPVPPPPPPPPPPPNLDVDGDGVQRPTDCDDNNPSIRPGARDRPGDGIDQNCRGGDAPYPLLQRRITAFLTTYPTGGYAQFDSMTVTPVRRGDRLRLTCNGRGCPLSKKTIRVRKNRPKLSLMRHLRGAKLRRGTVVQLRVTRPRTIGRVGKWTIRAPNNATILSRCLRPGAKRLSRCPA